VSAHLNPDWNGDCEQALYQTFKKFQNSVKKYEHRDGQTMTEQESVQFEKTLNDFMGECAGIVVQCQIAYAFDLLQRVRILAEHEGDEDLASLVGQACRTVEEFWEPVLSEEL